jgi:SAM-dependent MidA family methyltransferase
MLNLPRGLPEPDPIAKAHSQKLLQLIRNEINAADGLLSFARYMQLALYAPGLGYYSAGSHKLGEGGDFVTAPEISPLFARCIARQCQQILTLLPDSSILEFGAGSGIMAAEILVELERQNCLPQHYFILEISADLRQRQQQTLKAAIPHLFSRVVWLTELPATPITGIILANEVLDAMPVQRFCLDQNHIQEFYVSWEQDNLIWRKAAPSSALLTQQIQALQTGVLKNTTHYESEMNLLLPAWLKSLKTCLKQGLILLIDYGFPAHEYYHPDRVMGTLMCHYRQHARADPLCLPGLQDITAHVHFTAIAESAVAAGLTVAGYTTQAAFLLACGLLDFASADSDPTVKQQLALRQQIQKLTSPHEMGELFKVIALTYDMDDSPLIGFSLQDQRGRL